MLPDYGTKLPGLPRALQFARGLEEFEGSILSEYRASDGGALYLEKWCAREGSVNRFLVVRTEQRALAEYLGGRLSLLNLLKGPSDLVGFLVDRQGAVVVGTSLVRIDELPPVYLPQPAAFHDESLRPTNWATTPQSFLLDATWDARQFAAVERDYLSAFGFSFLTHPGKGRSLPVGVLNYVYNGGYTFMHVFNGIRDAIPNDQRAKSVGVSAHSPGVLTIDAPTETANHLAAALRALPGSRKKYDVLHSWSRLKPAKVDRLDATAKDHLVALCQALGVDVVVLLPPAQAAEPLAILTAGKLVASYYRKLRTLLDPDRGAEFISVNVSPVEVALDDDDEDDDDEDYGLEEDYDGDV